MTKQDLSPILGGYFLQITDTFFMTLEDGKITYANEEAINVLASDGAKIIEQSVTDFVKEEERASFTEKLANLGERTDYFSVHFVTSSNTVLEMRTRFVPLILNDKKLVMVEAYNEAPLNALKEKNEMLEDKIAHLSPLDLETHLPSPILLNDRIEQAILRALREARGDLNNITSYLTVIVANIGGLDEIAKEFGNEAKRYVMDILISRFKSSIRSVDTLAKSPEDTFYFLFENIRDKANINIITNRLQNCVNVPVLYKNQSIKFAMSMGASVYPDNGTSAVALIKWAKLNPITAQKTDEETKA